MLGLGFGLLSWFTDGDGAGVVPAVSAPSSRVITPVACWINNTPIEWMGLTLQKAPAWMSSASTAPSAVQMTPGVTGGRYVPLRDAAALTVSLQGRFCGVTLDNRNAVANAFADALRGLLEIRFPDAPTHVLRGVAGPVTISPGRDNGQFAEPEVQVSVDITCADSARYARHARQLVLTTTPTPVSLGTLASGGDLFVLGPRTGDLDIDLLAPSGQRIYRLALRGTDIDTDGYTQIRLDAPHALLVYDAAGVATSVTDWRSLTESSRWWKPTPWYADRARSAWPMLRLSAGTGLYRYHEAWEH